MRFERNEDLERFLSKYQYNDSLLNFYKIKEKLLSSKKEVVMAEKKGGWKVAVWIVSALVVVAVGWIGFTKLMNVKTQEKLQSGEAIVATMVVGDVKVQKMGADDWTVLFLDDILQTGDKIKTSDGAFCEIQMIDKGIFRIESGSTIELSQLACVDGKINTKIRLNEGEMALKPKELKAGETLEVETSTAVAAVRGTKFSVKSDKDGNIDVAVAEGKVALKPNVTAIQEAKAKGLITEDAAKTLEDQLVQPIEITPGEEISLEKEKISVYNDAISSSVEEMAQQEGGKITGETLAKVVDSTEAMGEDGTEDMSEQPKMSLADAIQKKTEKKFTVESAKKFTPAVTTTEDSAKTTAVVEPTVPAKGIGVIAAKKTISEESKSKLAKVSEDKILKKYEVGSSQAKKEFDVKQEKGEIETVKVAKTEPVKTETTPVTTEPVKTETTPTETVKTEPVKTEPAKIEKATTVAKTETTPKRERVVRNNDDNEEEAVTPRKVKAKTELDDIYASKFDAVELDKSAKRIPIEESTGYSYNSYAYTPEDDYLTPTTSGVDTGSYNDTAFFDEVTKKDPNVKTGTDIVKKAGSGDAVWQKSISFVADRTTEPVYYGGKIFTTYGNQLYILSTEGKIAKVVEVLGGDARLTRPVVSDGIIYMGSDIGGIYAYNSSGSLAWKGAAGKETLSGVSPYAAYGLVAVPSIDDGIRIYTSGGSLKCQVPVREQIFATPLLVKNGSILIYGTEKGEVVGYNINSQTELWRQNLGSRVVYPILGNDSVVVFINRDTGNTLGLDPATGTQKWSQTISGVARTKYTPMYAAGKIIYVNASGTQVYIQYISSGDFTASPSYSGISGTPFVSGDWLYVGTGSGELQAYNLKNEKTWTYSVGSEVTIVVADDKNVYAVSGDSMHKVVK